MAAVRLLAVCVFLVTAGCGGPAVSDATPAGTPGVDSTVGVATPTVSPRATATPLPAGARNPWRSAEIIVAVDDRTSPNRSFVRLVEEAVAYWNGPGRPNATYRATFRVVPAASDPDRKRPPASERRTAERPRDRDDEGLDDSTLFWTVAAGVFFVTSLVLFLYTLLTT
jgi:hypothetical protein